MTNSLADGQHFPCHLITKNTGIRSLGWVQGERLKHVAEIHSRCFDLNQHLAGPADRQRERSEPQAVKQPAFAGLEP